MEGICYLTPTSHTLLFRGALSHLREPLCLSKIELGWRKLPQLTLAGDDVVPQRKEGSILWDGGEKAHELLGDSV